MGSIFRRSGNWQNFLKNSPVTSIIIIINTIYLLVIVATGGFGIDNLFKLGAIYKPSVIDDQEWWRILTAAFMHGGFLHYIGNVIIGLLTLSSALERLIGSKKFTFIYFGSLLLSGLAVVFLGDSITVTIGASGAIFGVLGSLLFITFYRRDMLNPQDIQSIRSLIVVNILFTFLASGISISGHVSGILAGFLLSFLIIRRNIFKVMN